MELSIFVVLSLHFLADRCGASLRVIADHEWQGRGVPYRKNPNDRPVRYVVGVASSGELWPFPQWDILDCILPRKINYGKLSEYPLGKG